MKTTSAIVIELNEDDLKTLEARIQSLAVSSVDRDGREIIIQIIRERN